jgi:S-DNA-T family DNA segregation ATPase FtsK/SpoIIIE
VIELNSNKYKVVIIGKKVYKEYPLSNEDQLIKIGTSKDAQVRFNKSLFFEEFDLHIEKTADGWSISCEEDIYFTTDGILKIFSKNLQHGDEIVIKYQSSNIEIIRLNFFIDFDSVEKNYERVIDIDKIESISIGGSEKCDICIKDPLIEKDSITLSCRNAQYYIYDNDAKYGVFLNNQKIKGMAKLQDQDFFMIIGYSFYIKDKKLYASKTDHLIVNQLNYVDIAQQQSAFTYPKFNLNTRVKYVIPSEPIEILLPQPLQEPPKTNIFLTLAPAIVMLGVTIVLRGFLGSGGTFVIYSVISMTMGMIMSVVNVINNKKQYREKIKERKENYESYIKRKEKIILKSRQKELDVLQNIYKPLEQNIEDAYAFKKELFEKDHLDEDFLHVRIGTGVVEANCKVTYNKQDYIDTKDALVNIPEDIELKHRFIEEAPIITKLSEANAVGIVGTKEQRYKVLKNITLDLSIRHFYKQVKLFYMFSQEDVEQFSWIRWLRHVENDALGVRNLIYDEDSKNLLFEHLYMELSRRESIKENNDYFNTQYVIFVFDNKGIKQHPISKYIKSARSFGFTFIFFENSEDLLPQGCTEIIRLSQYENSGDLLYSINGKNISRFFYEPVQDTIAEEIAIKLTSVYVDEVSLEGQLTKNISLFELLNIFSVNDLDIHARWSNSRVYDSMAAPLGVKTKNQVVSLDLHEKYQGPHGLVAGTTGSGKSEILQSYILSMATLFHPYEVGFVIIDFKGGGMVNQFNNLPHLIGSITNIDGREIDRSLNSIKAELRKRQELFAQYGVNHVNQYIKKFKEGKTSQPLPHLILIVDEFAELKSDHPEFMKELVSAARIGRSLGVHLILATQKPSGVVDDQIWSNSKFKLCLKVQTKQDSNEVLKTPLAAEIKEPGRAYLQVGNNELFELFQSAYSGAAAETDDEENHTEYTINEVSLSGKKTTVFEQKKNRSNAKSLTQLEAVVQYISEYCESSGIKRLPGICLPPLPDVIRFSEGDSYVKEGMDIKIAIGIYDDPSHQRQEKVILNITEAHTFIVGSSQYGKTNILQTIIRALAQTYSPSEVNIYLLDFASMILKSFGELHHIGGVLTASNDENMKHFIKMTNSEIINRKETLSKLGLSSFGSYKEAGYQDLPQIVILIDNFTAFKELFGQYDEDMLNICREGIAVGISVVISNVQTSGIGYKYLSNFSSRIALSCNDTGEYSNLLDRCRMKPKNIAGRALIEIDKTIYEFQNYLGFDGEKEIERVKDMKKFIENTNLMYPGEKARQIPQVPRPLTLETLAEGFMPMNLRPYEVCIGIDYDKVEMATIDFEKIGTLLISGREKSGKTNFLKIVLDQFQKNILIQPTKAFIIDTIDRQLKDLGNLGCVEKYSIDVHDIESILDTVYDELVERQQDLMSNTSESLDEKPLLLIIIQNQDVLSLMSSSKEIMELYKKITQQLKALKVCFLFANVENTAVTYSSTEIYKILKENRKALIFDDISNHRFLEIPINILRDYKKPIEVGDAYYITNSDTSKIKTISMT